MANENHHRSLLEVMSSQAAAAFYRISLFMLTTVIALMTWIATEKLGDLKDVTRAVRSLETKITLMDGLGTITSHVTSDHERRIRKLEDSRNRDVKGGSP